MPASERLGLSPLARPKLVSLCPEFSRPLTCFWLHSRHRFADSMGKRGATVAGLRARQMLDSASDKANRPDSFTLSDLRICWSRGPDSNRRPSGYEFEGLTVTRGQREPPSIAPVAPALPRLRLLESIKPPGTRDPPVGVRTVAGPSPKDRRQSEWRRVSQIQSCGPGG